MKQKRPSPPAEGVEGAAAEEERGAAAEEKQGATGRNIACSWTEEEDQLLRKLVEEHSTSKWSLIAKQMTARNGKQCRERWLNHLNTGVQKGIWSDKEEALLVESHKKLGNSWSEIAKCIPGRSDNNVKNHWNSTLRRVSRPIFERKGKNGAAAGGKRSGSELLEAYVAQQQAAQKMEKRRFTR